mgnify:CR=1 FL=1
MKNHKMFPNGFKNYRGRVGIDGTIFNYVVRVGKNQLQNIFYDINLEVDPKVPSANARLSYNGSTSVNTKLSQKESGVNNNISKNNKNDTKTSVGNDTFMERMNRYNALIQDHRAIPKGETPARDVSVPKKSSKTEYVSNFARTMLEAEATPDNMISDFEKEITNGTMSHERISNASSEAYAVDKIKNLG